jgi:HPt (histidine-containing phosphotransfer) domain-containing protein
LTDNAEYLTLVQGFVRSLPERFTHMQTMVEQMQWEQLGAVAHQIKGSAGGLGHPELGETAAKIEACVSDQEYMEIPVIMDRLASLVSRAVKSPDIIRGT